MKCPVCNHTLHIIKKEPQSEEMRNCLCCGYTYTVERVNNTIDTSLNTISLQFNPNEPKQILPLEEAVSLDSIQRKVAEIEQISGIVFIECIFMDHVPTRIPIYLPPNI